MINYVPKLQLWKCNCFPSNKYCSSLNISNIVTGSHCHLIVFCSWKKSGSKDKGRKVDARKEWRMVMWMWYCGMWICCGMNDRRRRRKGSCDRWGSKDHFISWSEDLHQGMSPVCWFCWISFCRSRIPLSIILG